MPLSDDSKHPEPDWEAVRTSVRRRLQSHLQGGSPEDLEDATQAVMYKLLRFFARNDGPPRNLDGLLTVIARRTAVERIRAAVRARAHGPLREESAVIMSEAERHELALLEDEVQWRATSLLEWFRAHQAPCLELAEARANGTDFKTLAAGTGQSHAALLQRWSRCMQRLRAAIASGQLDWPAAEGDA